MIDKLLVKKIEELENAEVGFVASNYGGFTAQVQKQTKRHATIKADANLISLPEEANSTEDIYKFLISL